MLEAVNPKPGNGRPPIEVEPLLRMYFPAHWLNLADAALEDTIYESESMRSFVDIDLGRDRVPDESTACKLRHPFERNHLDAGLSEEIGLPLSVRNLAVNCITMVDATIINSPSSTKIKDKHGDPEIHQTRMGNQWYPGMKLRIGCASQTERIRSALIAPANVHYKHAVTDLLHGQDRCV